MTDQNEINKVKENIDTATVNISETKNKYSIKITMLIICGILFLIPPIVLNILAHLTKS